MPSARALAATRRWHLLVTVWPTATHRDADSAALRAASGVLSTGAPIDVTAPDGVTVWPYLPLLLNEIEVPRALGVEPQSVRIEVPWWSDDTTPDQVDWDQAVGEVARVWETADGYGVDRWDARTPRIAGPVSGWSWGTDRESITLSIGDAAIEDTGDWWEPDVEISGERYPDVDSIADRAIAPAAAGLLPPVVFAPDGSAMLAPLICVQDEIPLAGAGDLTPRRLLMGSRRPSNASSSHQALMLEPERDGSMMASSTSADYQAVPVEGQDDLGDTYWYLPGAFAQGFTATSVVTTIGSDVVTVAGAKQRLVVGDLFRAAGDNDADWEIIEARDGIAITLESGYNGSAYTGTDGETIRLPSATGYTGFRTCSHGGDVGPDGEPISHVCDVLISALRSARLNVPVALGDLQALRSRLHGHHVSAVITERQAPYGAWALDRLLSWLPIRPYRADGVLRFAWVGPVTAVDAVTELDLDDPSSVLRAEPIEWIDRPVYPSVRVRYDWSIWRERHLSTVTLDGTRPSVTSSQIPTGRAMAALARWRTTGAQDRRIPPTLTVESDAIGDRITAGLAAGWLLRMHGLPARALRLEISSDLTYIDPGDVLRLSETGAITSSLWRVEVVTDRPTGGGVLILEPCRD